MKSPNLKSLTHISVCCGAENHCTDYDPKAGISDQKQENNSHYLTDETVALLKQLDDAIAAVQGCGEINVRLNFEEDG